MAHVLPDIGWLITGAEGYGNAGTMKEIGRRILERGGNPMAFSLSPGAFYYILLEEGWTCVNLGCNALAEQLAAPPRGRLHVMLRSLATGRVRKRLVQELNMHSNSVLVTRSGALLPLLGTACRGSVAQPWWYMAGAVPLGMRGAPSRAYYRSLIAVYGINVIANSHYTHRSLYGARSVGAVIPTPIRIDYAEAGNTEPFLSEAGADGAVKLLICARLAKLKGHLEFVQAFLRVVADFPCLRLVVAGGGDDDEYRSMLLNLIEAHPRGGSVRLIGHQRNVTTLMRWADIVVNPSIVPESFGRVCVEAQGVGRPVLATALGGPIETILDGETGWLVAKPTVDAMEAGLRRALRDRGRWEAMGQAGKQRVQAEYAGEVLADRFIETVVS